MYGLALPLTSPPTPTSSYGKLNLTSRMSIDWPAQWLMFWPFSNTAWVLIPGISTLGALWLQSMSCVWYGLVANRAIWLAEWLTIRPFTITIWV